METIEELQAKVEGLQATLEAGGKKELGHWRCKVGDEVFTTWSREVADCWAADGLEVTHYAFPKVSWLPIEQPPEIAGNFVVGNTQTRQVCQARWKPRKRKWVFPHKAMEFTPDVWTFLPRLPEIEPAEPTVWLAAPEVPKEEVSVYEQWRGRSEREAPRIWEEAQRRAGEPVSIFPSDEAGPKGEYEWVVALADNFWMDAFPTEEEAEAFVKAMGWPRLENQGI